MIRYVTGDLFKSSEEVLVHGCNCFCTMGAGVALLVRQYYLDAYTADIMTKYGDKQKLGTYSSSTGKHKYREQQITIVNAYTQYYFGCNKIQFDYDAFENVFKLILKDFADKTICMPKIGAGLAGGDWLKI
jgi:O-acetyl-ADP-ribose deacetylase (regulator of RNase III)